MAVLILFAIVLLTAFLQTITGFGFALMAMPLVTLALGMRTAAPLVALLGGTLYGVNLLRQRQALPRREVLSLGAAAAVGVPVGIWGLTALDQRLVEALLGLVLISFSLFSLSRLVLPTVTDRRWGLLAGFLAGCLGGAYNTPGPPLIVYGSLRRWPRDEFRSVLQAVFLLSSGLVILGHALAGHFSPAILRSYLIGLPALLLGVLLGILVDQRLPEARFRQLVAVLILVLGFSMLL